jgi:biopolymer transport protein ExbB/TolQ
MVNRHSVFREDNEMTSPRHDAPQERPDRPPRSFASKAAFLIGVPLAAAVLAFIEFGPFTEEGARRYIKHPAEQVEVVLFCIALSALLAKLCGAWGERGAFRADPLPPWDGQTVPVGEAGPLRAGLRRLGRRLQNTYLVRRIAGVLDFAASRRSADNLDDQLRTLADNDSVALEGSYALIRFITWAIPILGFLGTVLGITEAIFGVTPEVMEKSLSRVTDGLGQAFDATALALGLTLILMFITSLVERLEQGVLEEVDRYADEELAHRFARGGAEGGEFVAIVRQNTQVLLQGTVQLAERQAEVWSRALAEGERRWAQAGQDQQQRLTAALEGALESTLEGHRRRLEALEQQTLGLHTALLDRLGALVSEVREAGREQQTALAQVIGAVTAQTEALARLQQDEKQLVRMQEVMQQNLTALAGAGAFEDAVHTLAAAIHLLTARAGVSPRLGARPGAAA